MGSKVAVGVKSCQKSTRWHDGENHLDQGGEWLDSSQDRERLDSRQREAGLRLDPESGSRQRGWIKTGGGWTQDREKLDSRQTERGWTQDRERLDSDHCFIK